MRALEEQRWLIFWKKACFKKITGHLNASPEDQLAFLALAKPFLKYYFQGVLENTMSD
jgi:hypothetical protein